MNDDVKFTPPYMFQGLYNQEARRLIEAANRATVAAIFKRQEQEREQQAWLAKVKLMHDQGVHYPGSCPYCPVSYYYD